MDSIVSAMERSVRTPSSRRPAVWRRRLGWTFILLAALATGAVLGLAKMGVDLPPPLSTPRISAWVDSAGRRAQRIYGSIVGRLQSYFREHQEESHGEQRRIVVTSPRTMDVVITQPYVCQIHSKQHIEVRALDTGYLQEISMREGQAVRQGDSMFRILPVLYKARYDAEYAEVLLAQRELNNTRQLFKQKLSFNQNLSVVSQNEVLLFEAKLARAQAKADLAEAELKFTDVTAPFDGIVDRQREQLGSFIKEGDILTTLSDNSVMWVYFNVPEKQYLEYMASVKQGFDLRLMSSVNDVTGIPTAGKSQIIIATVKNVLHFRIFDKESHMVVDTDEMKLTGFDLRLMFWGNGSGVPTSGEDLIIVGVDDHDLLRIRIFDAAGNYRDTDEKTPGLPAVAAGAIATLKPQLAGLVPPHVLTPAEKVQVLSEVPSIVGQTGLEKLTTHARPLTKLRKQLDSLWPPHGLNSIEKARVITAVTSTVGYTLMQLNKDHKVELVLANQEKFPQPGKIGAIEAQFNNENGNIAFRADFENPDGLLRHGQTGMILVHRSLKNALVIPQRATFELLDQRYVKVVGEDGVADQRLITVKHELEDIFVIDSRLDVDKKIGVDVKDRIVLEGVREVEVGKTVEYEFRQPEEALKNQKFHAE